MDLGGDIIDNPNLSGTTHNVFGNVAGVAIYFLVKKRGVRGCGTFYARRDEYDRAEDKLAWIDNNPASEIRFDHIQPDSAENWLHHIENPWSDLVPMVSKEVKARKRGWGDQAIFRTFTNGLQSKKDEWAYDFRSESLLGKIEWFTRQMGLIRNGMAPLSSLKWDRELERRFNGGLTLSANEDTIRLASFRPFTSKYIYYDDSLISVNFQMDAVAPFAGSIQTNPVIGFHGMSSDQPFAALSVIGPFDICLLKTGNGSSFGAPRFRFLPDGSRRDNVTDWALKQFKDRYGSTAGITRDMIFAYVYAALHDPVWRETYAINLRREFPHLPWHADFRQWADWGQRLLDLHIGYESVEPWPLVREDVPDAKARAAGLPPRPILKAVREAGVLILDSETRLTGVPPEAWEYRLGNRTALDWVLDQHKEKKPKDPTIRDRFDTYRFADYKERVADLLARVARVSVETMAIVQAMRDAAR